MLGSAGALGQSARGGVSAGFELPAGCPRSLRAGAKTAWGRTAVSNRYMAGAGDGGQDAGRAEGLYKPDRNRMRAEAPIDCMPWSHSPSWALPLMSRRPKTLLHGWQTHPRLRRCSGGGFWRCLVMLRSPRASRIGRSRPCSTAVMQSLACGPRSRGESDHSQRAQPYSIGGGRR